MQNRFTYFNIFILSFLCFFILSTMTYVLDNSFNTSNVEKITYKNFINMVEEEKVEQVNINFSEDKFSFLDKEGKIYQTDNPKNEGFKKYLLEKNIKVQEDISKTSGPSIFLSMMSYLMTGLVIVFLLSQTRKQSLNVLHTPTKKINIIPDDTLDSFNGNIEIKEECRALIDQLNNRQDYLDMGATPKKGVLFYGPPGTGKTLLARAIAAEARVPFFSVSGSDFVEIFAGKGALKVRDLFKEAREHSASIIFIDEIDAIAKKRSSNSFGGANDEREQTLNAILTEMDGFDKTKNILVIAATNRLDVLDEAILRAGRFDTKICIPLPDKEDRVEILKHYLANKRIDDSVSIDELATITIGMSGATLKALVNESAITAVRNKKKVITKEHFDEAYIKIATDSISRKDQNRDQEQIKLIAYHEAGHAIISKLVLKESVSKITIIPTTSGVGGFALCVPEKENLLNKTDLMNRVKNLYGGRAAEEVVFGDISTGASNDIERATSIIIDSICQYGMQGSMLNYKFFNEKNLKVFEVADEISKTIYEETKQIILKHRSILDDLANALIEQETMTEEEIDRIINNHKI